MSDAGPPTGPSLSFSHRTIYKNNEFFNLISDAIENGVYLWDSITNAVGPTLQQLVSLTFLLEEHTKSLFCQSQLDPITNSIIKTHSASLHNYYSAPSYIANGSTNLIKVLRSKLTRSKTSQENYYSSLVDESKEPISYWTPSEFCFTSSKTKSQNSRMTNVKDINDITTDDASNERAPVEMKAHEITNLICASLQNLPPNTVPPRPVLDTSANIRLRLNIIRHKYARVSTSSTI